VKCKLLYRIIMITRAQSFLPGLFLILSFVAMGCAPLLAGGAAGAGTAAWAGGELQTRKSASLDDVWQATETAVEDLDLVVTERQVDGLSGRIVARTADDTEVRIRAERETDDITELGIRVGIFGDQQQSQVILERIDRALS